MYLLRIHPNHFLQMSPKRSVTLYKWKDDVLQARSIMCASMLIHEKYTYTKENLLHLQELFGEESRTVRYEISKWLFCAKIKECEEVVD